VDSEARYYPRVSRPSWSRLWVLVIVGRLLLDVGTPLLPGAFQFDGEQNAESRVVRAQRAPAPLTARPLGPTPDLRPITALARVTAPRPTTAAHAVPIIGPRRLLALDRDSAPSSDDH
jgi:hypothetical protein